MKSNYQFFDKFHIDPIVGRNLIVYQSDTWGSNNFPAHQIKDVSKQLKFLLFSSQASVETIAQAIVKDEKFKILFKAPKKANYLLFQWQPTDILLLEALVKILERAGKVWDLKVKIENF